MLTYKSRAHCLIQSFTRRRFRTPNKNPISVFSSFTIRARSPRPTCGRTFQSIKTLIPPPRTRRISRIVYFHIGHLLKGYSILFQRIIHAKTHQGLKYHIDVIYLQSDSCFNQSSCSINTEFPFSLAIANTPQSLPHPMKTRTFPAHLPNLSIIFFRWIFLARPRRRRGK